MSAVRNGILIAWDMKRRLDTEGQTITYTYGNVATVKCVMERTHNLAASIKPFFNSYFTETPTDNLPDITVYLVCSTTILKQFKGMSYSGFSVQIAGIGEIVTYYEIQNVGTSFMDVCYIYAKKSNEIILIIDDYHRYSSIALMRTIRSSLKAIAISKGYVHFHAAACEINGTGLCITGTRRSGKTSTLFTLLRTKNVKFISNDKVLLKIEGNRCNLLGLPHKVGIRADTIRYLPHLNISNRCWEDFEYAELNQSVIQKVSVSSTYGPNVEPEDRLLLLPNEIAKLLGITITHQSTVNLMIFPVWADHLIEPVLEEVTQSNLTAKVINNILPMERTEENIFECFSKQNLDEWVAQFEEQLQHKSFFKGYYLYQNDKILDKASELLQSALSS